MISKPQPAPASIGSSVSKRPLDLFALFSLLLLCASWGLQQVAVKLALPAFPPLTQMALRSAGAIAIVLAVLVSMRRRDLLRRDGAVGWGLFAGALFATEFILIYVGLQWTDASRSSVFIYTAPFFVALGARWLLPDERLRPVQWVGLALSFIGVTVALGTPSVSPSARAFTGDLMLLAAGALWGATTLVIKASPLRRVPPEKVLLYQLGVAAVAAGVAALLLDERIAAPTPVSYWSLAYQTVWVGGVTFLLWFRLLLRYPASLMQAGTSLTPLLGVFGAFLILNEPLTAPFGLAVLLAVAGLVLLSLPARK